MRALALIILLAATPAAAHDQWWNGKEVDPVTKRVCCGQADAKHLEKAEVQVVPGGYRLDDTGETVSRIADPAVGRRRILGVPLGRRHAMFLRAV